MGKLEERYRDELVVLGIHSAKYPAEGDAENLRHAVQRFGIQHPVVNDPEYRIWDSYAVGAWPTLVFVSPQGEVIGRHAGEAPFEALAAAVDELIRHYEGAGALVRGPLDLGVEPFSRPADALSFPGNVLATDAGIFIADSGHHRIIVTDEGGVTQAIIGDGTAGLRDGGLRSARFNRPQGMALAADGTLYVADAENHAVRAIDLQGEQVRTVAGTGYQARRVTRGGSALETALSSPWDLAVHDGQLFIAMAGLHQVWLLDLSTNTLGVWAGTGHEGIRDGSRATAWLAQPMGLSLAGNRLYVACAEAQAVREIGIESAGVGTLAGAGLFEFGDEDGPVQAARLQHNQDVQAWDDDVLVADTYNNKIKIIDRSAQQARSWMGSGQAGHLDGPGANARFSEPTGLSLHRGILYVADTNNHLIRTVDLESGHVGTLAVTGLAQALERKG